MEGEGPFVRTREKKASGKEHFCALTAKISFPLNAKFPCIQFTVWSLTLSPQRKALMQRHTVVLRESENRRKQGDVATALASQAFIATLLFDPSMSALPIILKQNLVSVGLFTHE